MGHVGSAAAVVDKASIEQVGSGYVVVVVPGRRDIVDRLAVPGAAAEAEKLASAEMEAVAVVELERAAMLDLPQTLERWCRPGP